MERLYAPWRETYAKKADGSKNENAPSQDCVFCKIINAQQDETYFVLARHVQCVVMLNTYPYNPGHLLIVPHAHFGALEEYDSAVLHEVMDIIRDATIMLKKALNVDAVNVGLNMGKAAGASIPSHIHFHIVPRWIGDTNFLPLIADTKPVSLDLQKLYQKLLAALKDI